MISARAVMIFGAVLMAMPMLGGLIINLAGATGTGGTATVVLGILTYIYGPVLFGLGIVIFVAAALYRWKQRRKQAESEV
ncbi:MAG: hypothetical protein AAGP08_15645 [Pseudomonadota bacterium]